MNDSRRIAVFISHSWADPEQYEDLADLLDSIADLRWDSVSVERDQPFATETQGEPAQHQELLLQRERIARFEREIQQLRSERSSIRWAEERARAEFEDAGALLAEVRGAESSMFSVRTIEILEKKYGESIDALRSRAEARVEGKQPGEPADLTDLDRRMEDLDTRIRACQQRIEQIRSDSGLGVSLIRYRSRDILYDFPKISDEAIDEDRNLVLMLEAQIYSADIVIVIGEMFAQYRRWMSCELELAAAMGKPVLVILPPGQRSCPVELKHRADGQVPWDAAALGKALLALGG